MKKSLIVLMLAAAVLGAQALALPLPQQATPADTQQKKVIQDQAEGAAYMAAINATDPAQKTQQMEAFLQTYPNSVAKEDGYEFLVKTYQQLGDVAKVKASAVVLTPPPVCRPPASTERAASRLWIRPQSPKACPMPSGTPPGNSSATSATTSLATPRCRVRTTPRRRPR
jgi:biopolymer transport protein ExbD